MGICLTHLQRPIRVTATDFGRRRKPHPDGGPWSFHSFHTQLLETLWGRLHAGPWRLSGGQDHRFPQKRPGWPVRGISPSHTFTHAWRPPLLPPSLPQLAGACQTELIGVSKNNFYCH